MLTYQLDFMNDHGSRSILFVTMCFGDHDAVSLADAFIGRYARVQVWRGDTLIHEGARPKPH